MNFGVPDRWVRLGGVHVLVVDDDARFAGVLGSLLDYSGALVTSGNSASAALTLMATIVPRVLIVDLSSSPDVSSLLVAAARGPAHVGTLAIAPARADLPRDTVLAMGFEECLIKPIDLGQFCRVVARLAATTEPGIGGGRGPRLRPAPLLRPWLFP